MSVTLITTSDSNNLVIVLLRVATVVKLILTLGTEHLEKWGDAQHIITVDVF